MLLISVFGNSLLKNENHMKKNNILRKEGWILDYENVFRIKQNRK